MEKGVFSVRMQVASGYTSVEGYLTEEQEILLHSKWKLEWPCPLEFQGGVTSITCEQILEVPEKEFYAGFGRSKKNRTIAKEIRAVAIRNGEK